MIIHFVDIHVTGFLDYHINLFFVIIKYSKFMTWICSVRPNHKPVLSSFMTYHRLCSNTGATSGAGTKNPSETPQFTPAFLVGFVLLHA